MADASGWFALAGALGGGIVTGGIGLVTAGLTHRRQAQMAEHNRRADHDRQLRQERREIYATYWTEWNSLIRILEQVHAAPPDERRDRIRDAETAWRQTIDPMFIICSTAVLHAGITHVEVTEARIAAAAQGRLVDGAGKSRALSRAMRADLGV